MKHIANHRERLGYHGDRLKRGRVRFARLVRSWVESAPDDDERRSRLWRASVRAVEMGLWKYHISDHQRYRPKITVARCSRLACSAILGHWRYQDGETNDRYHRRESFGWHHWLHDHGWTACGEESDLYRRATA